MRKVDPMGVILLGLFLCVVWLIAVFVIPILYKEIGLWATTLVLPFVAAYLLIKFEVI